VGCGRGPVRRACTACSWRRSGMVRRPCAAAARSRAAAGLEARQGAWWLSRDRARAAAVVSGVRSHARSRAVVSCVKLDQNFGVAYTHNIRDANRSNPHARYARGLEPSRPECAHRWPIGPAAMQTCVTPQRSPVDRSRLPQPRDRLPGQPWAGGRPAAGSWGHRAAPLLVAGTPTACRIRSESRGARCALRSAGDRRRRAPRPSVDSCGCAYRAHSVGEQKRRMAGLGRV